MTIFLGGGGVGVGVGGVGGEDGGGVGGDPRCYILKWVDAMQRVATIH